MAAPVRDCPPDCGHVFSVRISNRTREAALHRGMDRNEDCESPWPQMYCTDGHELTKKTGFGRKHKQMGVFTRRRISTISFVGLFHKVIETTGDETQTAGEKDRNQHGENT